VAGARIPVGSKREREDGSAVVALEAQVEPVPVGLWREEQVVVAPREDDLVAGRRDQRQASVASGKDEASGGRL
jgi:hypothetical protein